MLGDFMMKNTAIYLRSADPNIDARYTDKPIFDFIEKHDKLSISGKDCLMYWDNCLGNFDPHKRSGFAKLMCDIRRKEIKSVIIAEPCVISTYPQMLIRTLYDLVILGVTVYCIDGTEITHNIIRAFDYCGVLAQVENLIANNANGRFNLIVNNPTRKIWHDTLEEEFYCKSVSEDGSESMHNLDCHGIILKDAWDKKDFTELELSYVIDSVYDAEFCEEIVFNNEKCYAWFQTNYDAEEYCCGVLLDSY